MNSSRVAQYLARDTTALHVGVEIGFHYEIQSSRRICLLARHGEMIHSSLTSAGHFDMFTAVSGGTGVLSGPTTRTAFAKRHASLVSEQPELILWRSAVKPFSIIFGILAAVLVICALLLVFGVRFTSDVMAYDPAKEIVATGTVSGHDTFGCPASDGELGDHVVLKTADKTYEVHLAPSRVMRSLKWKFNDGDKIEVRGAQVRFRGKEGLIARQVTKGDEIFTFRDDKGVLLVHQ